MRRVVLHAPLVLACLVPALAAGEAQPRRPERRIPLEEAVRLALERNLRLAAEKISPQRAHTVVVEQQAIFDPTAYGEVSRAKNKEQSTSAVFGQRQQSASGTLGVAKLFPPGTLVDVHAGAAREWSDTNPLFATINPAYSEEWGISISQPLLRGFGVRVNTAGIVTAQNERRMAQAKLRDTALTTLADVKNAYWALVLAIGERELLKRSLDRAQSLDRNLKIRIEERDIGARHPDVREAEAALAVRQEPIILADRAVRDAEDALKVITDLAADPGAWNVRLVPTTQPLENVAPIAPGAAVATALAKRPDYLQAKLAIENQEIVLAVRRNELRPRLDLTAGYGNTGLGASWSRADHELGSVDYYAWTLGITFEYPLGNRAARARFSRARLEREQARIDLKALERQIELEVRGAVRQVVTNLDLLAAASRSVKALSERVEATGDIKGVGRATAQDLLDAQAELAEAETRRLRALTDLNRALVDLQRAQGTLLEDSHVTWEEE